MNSIKFRGLHNTGKYRLILHSFKMLIEKIRKSIHSSFILCTIVNVKIVRIVELFISKYFKQIIFKKTNIVLILLLQDKATM